MTQRGYICCLFRNHRMQNGHFGRDVAIRAIRFIRAIRGKAARKAGARAFVADCLRRREVSPRL